MMPGSGDNSGQRNAQNAVQDGGQRKGQPQGQPPTGQAPRGAQESAVDKLKDPLVQDFAKGISALYAIVGVGLGLLVVLFGFIGSPVVLRGTQADTVEEVPEYGTYLAAQFTNQVGRVVVLLLPMLAVAAAVLVGLYAARSLDVDDQTTYLAAGVSSLAGSVLMVVAGGYLAASQVSDLQDEAEAASEALAELDNPSEFSSASAFAEEYQVEAVDLVINGVGAGVAAAIVAVATAYAYRNYLATSL
jgi:hypothetical protein